MIVLAPRGSTLTRATCPIKGLALRPYLCPVSEGRVNPRTPPLKIGPKE